MIFDHISKVLKNNESLWKVFWLWGFAGNLIIASLLILKRGEFHEHLYNLANSYHKDSVLVLIFAGYFFFSAILVNKNIYNTKDEAAAVYFRLALKLLLVLMIILIVIALFSLHYNIFYKFVIASFYNIFLPIIGGLLAGVCYAALQGFSKF